MNSDESDWRMEFVSALAEPLPDRGPGYPAWPAGSKVFSSIEIETKKGERVGFAAPNVVAMSLNLAMRAARNASALRVEFKFGDATGYDGPSRHIKNTEQLFDMFEQMLASISFSFTALEAYCNYVIGRNCQHEIKLQKKGRILAIAHEEAERNISIDDKLKSVLPKIVGVPTPAGKAIWEKYLALRKARNAITHFKYADQYPVGLRKVADPLIGKLLDSDPYIFPETVQEILRYFNSDKPKTPHWLEKMPAARLPVEPV